MRPRFAAEGLRELLVSENLAGRIDQALNALDRWRDSAGVSVPTSTLFVPGRIEVLGKHTDYAGGRSLVTATEQGFCVVARAREDSRFRMADLTRGIEIDFAMGPDLAPLLGHWSNYPQTVARRLWANFATGAQNGALRGADVAFTSDLPRAAGMSSSSALVVATYLVLAEVNALAERPEFRVAIQSSEALGGYLGAVENGLDFGSLAGEEGVGTFGGSEDQTAILCSRAGELRQYSYCPVRFERSIRLPEELCFAVAVSGVHASKTGSARDGYNRASELASAAAEVWRRSTGRTDPHLAAVLERGPATARELRRVLRQSDGGGFTPGQLLRRVEQFELESNEILPSAADALEAGDLDTFGRQVDRSQAAVERLLGNQIEETVFLARSARRLGAVAASAFGAGFGGSVWGLVHREQSTEFRSRWRRAYAASFPQHREAARFLETVSSSSARELVMQDGAWAGRDRE